MSAEQWARDLESVMATREGRRMLRELVFNTGFRDESFDMNSDRMTAYKEGRRSVGIGLDEKIQLLCPELWVSMQREYVEDCASRVQIIRHSQTQDPEDP